MNYFNKHSGLRTGQGWPGVSKNYQLFILVWFNLKSLLLYNLAGLSERKAALWREKEEEWITG